MLIWLVGGAAGILGTGLGAVLTFFVGRKGNRLPALLMGLSGGIMLAVVFFDILPEAIRSTNITTMLLGAVLGLAFVLLLSRLLPKREQASDLPDLLTDGQISSFRRTGLLLSTGIAIHNFPEGVAIGSGMTLSGAFGLQLALLIFAHNIPEGMAMSLPLRLADMRKSRILLLGLIVGSPTALGAWMGAYLGSLSQTVIGLCLGFAGGAMLYLTLKELIPAAARMRSTRATVFSLAAGVAVGAALVFLL